MVGRRAGVGRAAGGDRDLAGWVVRRLGWETGNVHLGSPGAQSAVRADLGARPAGWLAAAARSMLKLTRADWKVWRAHLESASPATARRPPAGRSG